MYKFRRALFVIILCLSPIASSHFTLAEEIAQFPDPLPPTTPKLPEPEFLPPPQELLPSPQVSPSPSSPLPEAIPGTITVERFEVVGSTVFSSTEFDLITAPFTQRPITFAELLQVQDAITQLYIQEGYITSGAFTPPQALQDGVVIIEVLEGEVEGIEITGSERLKPSYIRSRLARATQAPFQVNRLLEALQLLQLDPLIKRLSAELTAGSHTGSSILALKVEEAPTFSTVFRLDNGRSPSVGSVRRQISIREGNLLGFGDAVTLAYTNTEGSNALDELSYTLPINSRNGTVQFSYSLSGNNVIEAPFNEIDIESNSRNYQITYRQPLWQTPSQEFALGVTAQRRESETSLLNVPFPLSAGSNDDGETKLSVLRFFQEWTNRGSQEVLALRSQFNLGLNVFNATDNNEPPDGQFFSWQGQAQYLRLLAPDTLLVLRSDLQLASETLVPIEQFGLGGISNIRGYRQDFLLADNGLFASAEVRFPIARISEWNSILQLVPFFDYGTVWNSSDRENPNPTTLSSVGVGLLWRIGQKFTARLDWGVPLVEVDRSEDTWQEKGIYFSLEYRPF